MEITTLESILAVVVTSVGIVTTYYRRQYTAVKAKVNELEDALEEMKNEMTQMKTKHEIFSIGCVDANLCKDTHLKIIRQMDRQHYNIVRINEEIKNIKYHQNKQ